MLGWVPPSLGEGLRGRTPFLAEARRSAKRTWQDGSSDACGLHRLPLTSKNPIGKCAAFAWARLEAAPVFSRILFDVYLLLAGSHGPCDRLQRGPLELRPAKIKPTRPGTMFCASALRLGGGASRGPSISASSHGGRVALGTRSYGVSLRTVPTPVVLAARAAPRPAGVSARLPRGALARARKDQ